MPAPPRPSRRGHARFGLLLAPGAGAGREQTGLVAIDEAVCAVGGFVRRMDFPYRLAGRRAPDRPDVLVRSVAESAAALSEELGLVPGRIYLGGRSMGGRVCSMAVARGLEAAGLVLVSYPLHPPGKPMKLRTDHFPSVRVPCLFVSGARDPFGTPDEIRAAVAGVAGDAEIVLLGEC